jgi:hypothetical protein
VFGKVDTTALLGKLKRHIKTLREALDGGP